MKTLRRPRLLWPHLCLFLLVLAFSPAGTLRAAAPEGRVNLKLELAEDRQSAKVTVPEGTRRVTLMKFRREGGWQKFLTRNATRGVMKFKLPPSGKGVRWRAIGHYPVERAARKKFPAAFYQGQNRFGAARSGSRIGGDKDLVIVGGEAAPEPVEADIWKIDGSTVYFFNQLRGLQVLDLADPADPRLTASLRLPAVGQDLYLLPGSGPAREIILLTEIGSRAGESTRINIVRVAGGKARIVRTRDVPGSLADSRLIGNRLILATTEWSEAAEESAAWKATSRLSEWLISPDQAPEKAAETLIDGGSPLIASGRDWLAVAVHPDDRWTVSEVTVFAIRKKGLVRMGLPVRTEGVVAGKFGIHWSGNILTTISEKNTRRGQWSPTTVLENFRAWAPEVIHTQVIEDRLGSLRLAKGESLYATRFADGRAYIVTFLQTDPLWVVDLSDPRNPKVAGHLEVPGWSSHLEPIGDLLLSIGWESDTVAASLFDVADPAAPKLLRRLHLGPAGSSSEAMWDEKALKVLPAAGLALVPLTSYNPRTGVPKSSVQLLDIDVTGRDLRLRGAISHAFDPRRAALVGKSVVSISQRLLVSADIANRDAPALLAEVSLAWPVDRVLEAGDFLIEIENGGWYGGGTATARIAPATAPDEILAELDLGKGTVKAVDYRAGKLHVIREIPSAQPLLYSSPLTGGSEGNRIVLDIYDASLPTALAKIGTCGFKASPGARFAVDRLLWPRPDRPAVIIDFRYSYWHHWGAPARLQMPETLAAAASPLAGKSSELIFPPYQATDKAPRLIVFNTTAPATPEVLENVALGPQGSCFNGVCHAGDGLIAAAIYRHRPAEDASSGTHFHGVRVAALDAAGNLALRPLIDLPGELFAITDFDSNGFLAYTLNATSFMSGEYQASACDGRDAFLIATVEGPSSAAATAGGRQLFIAQPGGVARFRLDDQGRFQSESALETGGQPYSLRWVGDTLLGTRGKSLFAWDTGRETVKKWRFPTWDIALDPIQVAADGELLVPFGEFGAVRLKR